MLSFDNITVPNTQIPSRISLEDYLNCLNKPALILSSSSQTVDSSPTLSLLFANNCFLALCGVRNRPLMATKLQDLIEPRDQKEFLIWLQNIHSSEVTWKETCTIRLCREHLEDVTDVTTTERKGELTKYEIVLEWSGVCINHESIVLTGSVIPISELKVSEQENIIVNIKGDDTEQKYITSEATGVPQEGNIDDWEKVPQLVSMLSGGGAMGEMLRSYDWSSSPLGPIIKWPQSLLTAVSLCMASTLPMAVWWGPRFTIIYNDAYQGVAGQKHPAMFGKEGKTHWAELWDDVGGMANLAMQGTNSYIEDNLLFMTRNGYLEETYITWSYVPIRQEDGTVGGFLNPYIEVTERIIAERRLKTLRDIGAETGMAKDTGEVFASIGRVLSQNPYDVTFAALYTYKKPEEEGVEETYEAVDRDKGKETLHLTQTVGISTKHPSIQSEVRLSAPLTTNSLEDAVRLAHSSRQIVLIDLDESFGEVPIRGWDSPARQAAVSPITGSNKDGVIGVLVMGLNPRREYDESYETFVELVCRQTGSAIVNICAYEEEVRRFRELAAVDRAKTAFFSSVSHELRTPLTLILGPAKDLLSEKDLALETKSKITYMYRNAERLLRLVNLLLDFSKIEAGKMKATFQETDLGKFTADLASMFRSAIEKGGVEYRVECDKVDRTVWVDRDMWEKIVFNLVGNAFKFTMKGSITVALEPSADQSHIVLSVTDTGDGIPSHEILRVFERFHRVEGRRGRSHEGTGIGLALTQELTKLHGGNVGVTSEFGKGSTFTVQIPFGNDHLPKDRLVQPTAEDEEESDVGHPCKYGRSYVNEASQWLPLSDEETTEYLSNTSSTDSNAGGSVTFPVVSKGCRVLLVDDNVDMRKYIKSILERWWRVTEANDGEQAYQLAVAEPPDLIVSDVMMPNLDGFGLLKILRTQPLTKFIPVILLSAQAGEEARVDGLNSGADDYLVKPFSAKELVARVHTHLELGKLRIELEKMVKERTKELLASEMRYKTLAKLSPVGIFKADLDGNVTYTNDKWWIISGHNREEDPFAANFMASVHPEDRERADQIWKDAIQSCISSVVEFRWKWANGESRWCLCEMIVQYDEEMKACGFVGALTDLTERKILEQERLSAVRLAEQQQRHRAEEAEEVKRQQELYIDMTCHELRNPLNGIYHSADLLHESLEKVQREVRKESIMKVANWLEKEITDDLDVVDTITLCAQHQKKIADDVLHMSKINMNLLVLSKTNLRPINVVTNVLRMFETEVRLKGIDLQLVVAEGYSRMKVDWVRGDPTRFTQVMINFLTNAIRFTERVPFRQVTVTLDAFDRIPVQSSTEPFHWEEQQSDIGENGSAVNRLGSHVIGQYELIRGNPNTMVDDSETAAGLDGTVWIENQDSPAAALLDAIYIAVAIKDSGVGMSKEEQANLFKRFTQANPRTYAEFGGSGLGLFISKRLVELQDGEITVNSKKGDGTTFTFYIKCDRGLNGLENTAEQGRTEIVKEFQQSALQKSVLINDVFPKGTSLNMGNNPKSKKLKRKDTIIDIKTSFSDDASNSSPTRNDINVISPSYVLVVEDNLINQRVLKRQLELAGFSVSVAKHGAEALEVLKETSFHLILMDLEMPVMGGLECTRRIRDLEQSTGAQNIPIIGVSGNAREEYRRLAIESGMSEYVIKPYNKQELMNLVTQYVQKYRLR